MEITGYLKTNKLTIEMIIGLTATWLTYIYTNSAFITAVIASIGFVVFYFINKSIEDSDKKEVVSKEELRFITENIKREIISKWKNYEVNNKKSDEDGDFLFVGIGNNFTQFEIELLIHESIFTKEQYENNKNNGSWLP